MGMARRTAGVLRGAIFVALLAGMGGVSAETIAEASIRLAEEIQRIEDGMSGQMGVYVRHLTDDWSVSHRLDRDWYLASTIKVPLAVAVLQRVEAGELALDHVLTLAETDLVDVAGDLLWHRPGHRFTVDDLLRRSIEDSDSSATDMLIRLLGEASFNRQVRERIAPTGFSRITTILQVRYDAYSEVHPAVGQLSNRDFIELRSVHTQDARYGMLLDKLGIEADDAVVSTSREAFERYYRRGLNSANLEAFGLLLERLLRGELLAHVHTDRLLEYMQNISTGDRRIKAGLPNGVPFAQKTGTQIARACNVGILDPRGAAVVVAACIEGFEDLRTVEAAFEALGRALYPAE